MTARAVFFVMATFPLAPKPGAAANDNRGRRT